MVIFDYLFNNNTNLLLPLLLFAGVGDLKSPDILFFSFLLYALAPLSAISKLLGDLGCFIQGLLQSNVVGF